MKKYLFHTLVFAVVLEIGLEIISVFLFLFSEIVGIDSVGVVPAFVGSFEHSALAADVVDGIDVCPV